MRVCVCVSVSACVCVCVCVFERERVCVCVCVCVPVHMTAANTQHCPNLTGWQSYLIQRLRISTLLLHLDGTTPPMNVPSH